MLAAAQIRTDVASRLSACALTAGRVFAGRYWPVTESEMPCWFVAIDQENIQADGLSWPSVQTHSLRLLAEGFAADADNLETTLDTLQSQGLQALFAALNTYQLRCIGTRRRVADAEGQSGRVGVLTLYLEATFLTLEGQPDNFNT